MQSWTTSRLHGACRQRSPTGIRQLLAWSRTRVNPQHGARRGARPEIAGAARVRVRPVVLEPTTRRLQRGRSERSSLRRAGTRGPVRGIRAAAGEAAAARLTIMQRRCDHSSGEQGLAIDTQSCRRAAACRMQRAGLRLVAAPAFRRLPPALAGCAGRGCAGRSAASAAQVDTGRDRPAGDPGEPAPDHLPPRGLYPLGAAPRALHRAVEASADRRLRLRRSPARTLRTRPLFMSPRPEVA